MYKLYNGCPNDELQAHWDAEDGAEKLIRSLEYRITYFPMEQGYYMSEIETYKSIGDLFRSKQSAAYWLKKQLEKQEE